MGVGSGGIGSVGVSNGAVMENGEGVVSRRYGHAWGIILVTVVIGVICGSVGGSVVVVGGVIGSVAVVGDCCNRCYLWQCCR